MTTEEKKSIAEDATDTQVKYIIYLTGKYYRNDREKKEDVIAKLELCDFRISRKDAHKAINIMRKEVKAYESTMHSLISNKMKTMYFASVADMWDDSEAETLNEIWDRL